MKTAQQVLHDVFGYSAFRPGQEEIITLLTSEQNVLAVMPTGAGKSICYQIPAVMADRLTIVVSPLLALMDDQVAALRANGVDVACIHSGLSREQNIVEWQRVKSGAKLLYLSPERLMTERMLTALAALQPAMFVIDEAHWTHPGKVEAPYTVCIASASNLTGLVESSVECRRTGL